MIDNIYELKFDEELMDGVYGISLVQDPAIGVMAMKFSKEATTVQKWKMSSEEKRIIVSPVLIPNQKVYRNDISGTGEGCVFVTESTIEQLQQNFFKKQFNHNSTIEHLHPIDDGVFVFESWIIEEPENDKSNSLGFKNLPKGTWMVSMKVENDSVWNNYVKTGKIGGISMDALLQPVKIENSKNFNFKNQMKKINFKAAFKKAVARRIAFNADLMEVKVSDEVSYFVEALEIEKTVFDVDGNIVADVEFVYEGLVYKTNDQGVIVEIESEHSENPMVDFEFSDEDVEAIVEEIKEEIVIDYEAQVAELNEKIAELEAKLALYEAAEAEAVELKKNKPATKGIKTTFSRNAKPASGVLGALRSLK